MKHLGDISKINGAEIEPVDIITFGSPCQDLSVAGKRAGLEGKRSGLFMEAVRIIKEMREVTDGKYPRFALWENVPGAFSSNKGEDFRVVLEELIKIVEPTAVMPAVPKKGWAYADSHVGDGWSIAYRVFDTQYWPRTPQRRRRIYLVADFRGQCAREILFKSPGLHGHLTESGTPRERVAAYVEVGARTADCQGFDGYNSTLTGDKSATLGVNCGMSTGRNGVMIAVATQQGGAEISEDGICPTVTAAAGMSGNNQPWVVYNGENITNPYNRTNPQPGDPCHTLGTDSRNYLVYALDQQGGKGGANYAEDVMPTLCSDSHGTPHAVAYGISSFDSNAMKSVNPHSGIYEAETSRTLDLNGGNPACNQGGIAIVESVGIDTNSGAVTGEKQDGKGNGLGVGEPGDLMNTLTSGARHAVAYLANGENVTGTLCSGAAQRGFSGGQEVFNGNYHIIEERNTLDRYTVRRLTPTECARLQGFPDTWGHPNKKESLSNEEYEFWLEVRNTHAAINGKTVKDYTKKQLLSWYNKLHSDSAEYKMWGNGIALPTALYCMQGVADVLQT